MKQLYLIGGAMGVGKTTVCQILKKKLSHAVFLDGDWCWDADPFQVTEETKAMVLENICYLLNQFLHCSAYEHIIFCWVMDHQRILDDICSRLDTANCKVTTVSLICTPQALTKRLQQDIDSGLRASDAIQNSIRRLPLYHRLNTIKIDVSALTPEQTAAEIEAFTMKS